MGLKPGRILEFFIIGVLLGVIEDMIAVRAATGALITWKVLGIIVLVAIPFAIISELVVDHYKPFNHKRKKKR